MFEFFLGYAAGAWLRSKGPQIRAALTTGVAQGAVTLQQDLQKLVAGATEDWQDIVAEARAKHAAAAATTAAPSTTPETTPIEDAKSEAPPPTEG